MENTVLVEITQGVAIITFNRPAQRNAMNLSMREEFAAAILAVRDDPEVKAVVLTGAGGSFCGGGDLSNMLDATETGAVWRDRMRRHHVWFTELVNLEKPVIAAVDGPAYGAGLSLALAADFILATPGSRFCAVFGRVGLVPDLGAMYLLPRIVGLQRAKELAFSTREFDGEEAQRMGIVFEVVDSRSLHARARALAAKLTNASREALGMAKSIMNQSFQLDAHAMVEMEAYAQTIARMTPYHHQAISDFVNKRPLRFNGNFK